MLASAAILPSSPVQPATTTNSTSWPQPIPPDQYHPNQDLIDRNSSVIMGWSARAASTLAVEMFIMSIGQQADASSYLWPHQYREDVLDNDGHLSQEDDMKNGSIFKWKLVMNPFHRAVASYDHQMNTERGGGSVFTRGSDGGVSIPHQGGASEAGGHGQVSDPLRPLLPARCARFRISGLLVRPPRPQEGAGDQANRHRSTRPCGVSLP